MPFNMSNSQSQLFPNQPSPTATKVITLLENAKTLALQGQDRKLAIDVLEACKILAHEHNFNMDDMLFEHLSLVLKDKMPQSLQNEFDTAEEAVLMFDMER